MENKSDKIRAALAIGDTRKAISVASKFFDRSDETQLYKQAQAAIGAHAFNHLALLVCRCVWWLAGAAFLWRVGHGVAPVILERVGQCCPAALVAGRH